MQGPLDMWGSLSLLQHLPPSTGWNPPGITPRDVVLTVPRARGLQKRDTRDILTTSTHALWHKAGTLLQPTRCLFKFFFLQKTKPYQPGVLVHKSPQHDSWSKRTGLLTDSGFHVCLLVQGTAACSRQPLQNGHPFLLSKKHPLMWSLGKRVAQLIHTQHCK